MKILLATDGSDCSAGALDLLRRLPLPEGSSIVVLHVTEDAPAPADPHDEGEFIRSVRADLRARAERLVQSAAATLDSPRRTVRTRRAEGDAAEQIMAVAGDEQADLIVVGSHGHRGLSSFLLGSVARNVATYAEQSVLVARPQSSPPSGATFRMMLAYDDSPPARALAQTIAQLPLTADVHVALVTVVEITTFFRQDIRERLSRTWQQRQQDSRSALEAAAATLRDTPAHVTTHLVEAGSAAEGVLEAVAAQPTDLLLCGSTGVRGFQRLLLGSVAGRLVAHAPCPVWIGRGGDA